MQNKGLLAFGVIGWVFAILLGTLFIGKLETTRKLETEKTTLKSNLASIVEAVDESNGISLEAAQELPRDNSYMLELMKAVDGLESPRRERCHELVTALSHTAEANTKSFNHNSEAVGKAWPLVKDYIQKSNSPF